MIALVVGLLVLSAATVVTYQYTKAAYHAVGFNDGSIDSGVRAIERLAAVAGVIPECTNEQQREGKQIVSVKAEAIYAIAKSPGLITLCKAR